MKRTFPLDSISEESLSSSDEIPIRAAAALWPAVIKRARWVSVGVWSKKSVAAVLKIKGSTLVFATSPRPGPGEIV
jgi:hypothetical protein